MNSVEDLISLIQDELGIAVTADDVDRSLDQIPGWDSVHLLWLVTLVEQRTGRPTSLPDLLEARDIVGLYNVLGAA
ncbi:MAG TPA: phosphopantetheine-binding protein [Actinocrinis sp.]|nr:phosphopantetheine-binding protein [Actinocrinis sp.]